MMKLTPFKEGERAAYHGFKRKSNPYERYTQNYMDWLDGYNLERMQIEQGI